MDLVHQFIITVYQCSYLAPFLRSHQFTFVFKAVGWVVRTALELCDTAASLYKTAHRAALTHCVLIGYVHIPWCFLGRRFLFWWEDMSFTMLRDLCNFVCLPFIFIWLFTKYKTVCCLRILHSVALWLFFIGAHGSLVWFFVCTLRILSQPECYV